VRSALLAVKGVTRAKVTLSPPEAIVTYDPTLAKPEDLIAAVGSAEGVNPYSATMKVKKR
jgi:hypothetical protein